MAYIPPFGIYTVPVRIKTQENVDIRPYTIPLFVDTTFPIELSLNNTSSSPFHLGNIKLKVPATHINQVNQTYPLSIFVEQYSWDEKFADFWKTFGGPISLIAGGFAGGFSGWVFGRFQKTKQK